MKNRNKTGSSFYQFEPKPKTSVKNVKERKHRTRLLVYPTQRFYEWWQKIVCKDGSIKMIPHYTKI